MRLSAAKLGVHGVNITARNRVTFVNTIATSIA